MANEQVDEVKQKTDIVQLVSEYVTLKKAGRNFKGNCPFHGEKTPSFMVNSELQIFKCFGCQEGGDAITFLQKIEGMEFGEALENLAKRVGVVLTTYKPSMVEQTRDQLYKLLDNAAEAYHFMLTKHGAGTVALEYLKRRGITSEAIEKFRLGYVPEGWSFIYDYLVKKKGFSDRELESAGLVVPGNRGVYDRFRNRVMFPLANNRGQVVGFAGRILPQVSSTKTQDSMGAKYINTPETEIYHKGELLYGFDVNRSEIKLKNIAVVVEGEIDAIVSWQANVKNVVAIKGSALTERQVELLSRVCETIVMALDADVAGDAASRRGIQIAEQKGINVKIARWIGGKDPGDLAIENPEAWKKAVAEAIPVYDFYLLSAVERNGLEASGKQKIGRELLPIWQVIPDEIVKAHYIQKLATTLGVSEQVIREQMGKHQNANNPNAKYPISNESGTKINSIKENERSSREGRVVLLAILGKKTDKLSEKNIQILFQDSFWLKAGELLQKNELDELPAEVKAKITDLLLTDEEFSEKKWEEAIRLLELLNIEEELGKSDDLERIKLLGGRKAELKKEV